MRIGKAWFRLRTFNNTLSVLVALLALYVIGMPFVPAVTWWTKHEAPVISKPATAPTPKPWAPTAPVNNTIVVPSMGLTTLIHEGQSVHTLHYGVWHIPDTSSPDKGSNTVLAGHRYTYSGSGIFYHLDRLRVGDSIYVYWQQKRYQYVVNSVETVPPTDVAVDNPTKMSQLTLYTCTPLWTFTNRLVVTAQLQGITS